jgi:hypothetical protein
MTPKKASWTETIVAYGIILQLVDSLAFDRDLQLILQSFLSLIMSYRRQLPSMSSTVAMP